jgi:hypothetical protein
MVTLRAASRVSLNAIVTPDINRPMIATSYTYRQLSGPKSKFSSTPRLLVYLILADFPFFFFDKTKSCSNSKLPP